MIEVKADCRHLIPLLTECAEKCDEYVRDLVPKHHCIKPAQEVIQVAKNMVVVFKDHIKECTNTICSTACHATMRACEKAIEKSTACVDVCLGAGSDEDAKIVCADCAQACRDCMKSCDDCVEKACA
ncbi:MAG: hypothetical protein WC747_01785 [Candidatus Babeliales bacterium]|jgi:hypothetical protein